MLLNLPALADPTHAERSADGGLVDLLFFPTGGGKTEAYLGLTAFAIAIRRLQGVVGGRDGRDGVAVLMRYTLRLLTLQQFQRAAALLCACELRRRALYGKGETERAATLGHDADADRAVGRAELDARTAPRTPRRGSSRPGSAAVARAARRRCSSRAARGAARSSAAGATSRSTADRGRTLLPCSDTSGQCAFTPRNSPGEGLPVVVVDEEVYRLLPALVIATVDKFARMPWEGRVQALFGQVSRHCDRHGYLTPGEEHPGQHPEARRAAAGRGRRRASRCARPT